VDHRRLLCHPTAPILHGDCNLNGRSLPHAPLSGCSTTTNATTPRQTLVDRFGMKNGINEPFTKTNRLPDCCRRGHVEGPFFMVLALARTTPTGFGRGPSMYCGRTSTRRYSRSTPLAHTTRRLPAANSSSSSKPHVPASRRLLPFANAFASSASALPRDNGRLNLLPNKNRRPPEPSSYGSAAAASLSGLITGLCDGSNAKPLLHTCATSRTAAGMRRHHEEAAECAAASAARADASANLHSRLVPMPDLAAALVSATYLARPFLLSRCLLPPTLTYCRGGAHGLQRPRPSRLSRSAVSTTLRCGSCCPL